MVSVVSDQTEISYAESVTGWSGDTFNLENQILVQGGNSVAVIQTANGINDAIFTIPSGSWNMSGSHLRMYLSSNIMPNTDTEAGNGIQMFADDGTNRAYFTVGGSDTYSGGWRDFFVAVDSTPTSGSVNSAAVTSVGLRINTTTKPRNATNGWYDNWRFGNGLEINSTAAEAINFTDAALEDSLVANKYDILENTEEVLFAKGKLTLGNTAGALNCNLVSVNEQITFIDRVVSGTLYGIIGTEGTGATDIDIQGLVCKTNGATGAEFDFSAAITSFSLAGSTFLSMGEIKLSQGTADVTSFTNCGISTLSGSVAITGCTWTTSSTATLSGTMTMTDSTFKPATGITSVNTDSLDKLTNNNFTSLGTGYAVELTALGSGTMAWDNDSTGYAGTDGSTGNETIFVNVASGTLTINVGAGYGLPTIRTAGAVVTVVSGQATIAFTVNPAITGYEWRLYEKDATAGTIGSVELDGEEVATVSTQSYVYTYTADTDIVYQVIATGYEESLTYLKLLSNDQTVTINLTVEENT